ncbi:MAG: DUF3791 domain-containing protein [Synergistaceae bacterium]|jgi:hypothetical protein|nr:DUF3791 domain-containing protein [Synergistaceae bacterium]
MSEIDFMAYCIEEYKAAKHLNGRDVMDLFGKYDVLRYIDDHYGALHTTGSAYIVEDINRFIDARRESGSITAS